MAVILSIQANVTVAVTTTVIAAANAARLGGIIQNQSNGNVWLGLDIPAVIDASYLLRPGESVDFGNGFPGTGNITDFFVGAVNGIFEPLPAKGSNAADATGVVRVIEVDS